MLNYRPWRNSANGVKFETEPIRIARSIRDSAAFANPFLTLPTGATAHIAPGFPFLLFFVLKAGDEGRAAALFIEALPVLCLALELALLPWIAPWFGFSSRAGALASVLGILTKPGTEPQWEAHLAALLWLLTAGWLFRWGENSRRTRDAAAAGILAGIAFQFQPVLALPYFASVLILLSMRSSMADAAAVIAIPLLLCAPWSIRNHSQLGTFALRDNLGIELYVSFNSCAPAGFQENMSNSCITDFHPNSNYREAEQIKLVGEAEYNRQRMKKAMQWMSANPGRTTRLVAQRFWLFWFPVDGGMEAYRREPVRYLSRHLITVLSLVGLYLGWRQRARWAPHFAAWLLLFPLVYYLIQFAPRYRYPLLWVSWLLAGHAVMEISKYRLRRSETV